MITSFTGNVHRPLPLYWVLCGLAIGALAFFSPVELQGQVGRGCHVFRQCPNGYSCHPIIQRCYNSPRRAGQPCSAGYSCGSGLRCEAGSQRCRGPGGVGDSCHATRPCGRGLQCEAGSQRCRAPGKLGDACHATRRCGDGFNCQTVTQKCVSEPLNLNSSALCSSIRVPGLATAARDAGATMSYGAGSTGAFGGAASIETGAVYGQDGEFGCFATVCHGISLDASVSNFASLGVYRSWRDFSGASIVTQQGVSTPFIRVGPGFTTGQVLSVNGQLVGSANSFSIGAGISPVPFQVGALSCYTVVAQANERINALSSRVNNARAQSSATAQQPTPRVNPTPQPRNRQPPAPARLPTSGFVRIQNRWKPAEYLHNERGTLVSGQIQSAWWSAQWIVEPVQGTSFVRLRNRWKPNEYVHIERGPARSGPIDMRWWSAMWSVEPVRGTQFVRIRNRWKPNQYLHIERGRLEAGAINQNWWSAQWSLRTGREEEEDNASPAETAALSASLAGPMCTMTTDTPPEQFVGGVHRNADIDTQTSCTSTVCPLPREEPASLTKRLWRKLFADL